MDRLALKEAEDFLFFERQLGLYLSEFRQEYKSDLNIKPDRIMHLIAIMLYYVYNYKTLDDLDKDSLNLFQEFYNTKLEGKFSNFHFIFYSFIEKASSSVFCDYLLGCYCDEVSIDKIEIDVCKGNNFFQKDSTLIDWLMNYAPLNDFHFKFLGQYFREGSIFNRKDFTKGRTGRTSPSSVCSRELTHTPSVLTHAPSVLTAYVNHKEPRSKPLADRFSELGTNRKMKV